MPKTTPTITVPLFNKDGDPSEIAFTVTTCKSDGSPSKQAVPRLQFISSNPEVFTFASTTAPTGTMGILTAVGPGTATFTAKALHVKSVEATGTVTVTAPEGGVVTNLAVEFKPVSAPVAPATTTPPAPPEKE